MKKCDSCFYCKLVNGKCVKNNNQNRKDCKDYSWSSVKTNFYEKLNNFSESQ